MVVFTCNACGESLKKNQVEKHYTTRCRNCSVLSCVDCGKDFWGEEYQSHTKCITEEEKYSGKNYVPKANANKGEKKQNQWLQQVQDAIDKSVSNPRLKHLLERMKDYPNIPRKKAKFENFVRNSLNTRDNNLVTQSWDLLLANVNQNMAQQTKNQENGKPEQQSSDKTDVTENGVTEEQNCEDNEKSKSKRERKEERRKKSNKKEKKDKESSESENKTKSKKRKKQKKGDTDEDDVSDTVTKKQKRTDTGAQEKENEEEEDETRDDDEDIKPKKTKFDWVECITTLLQSKGELPLKKLKRKVLAEYASQGGKSMTDDKLSAKFTKKVTKNPTFVVHKERVKIRDRK